MSTPIIRRMTRADIPQVVELVCRYFGSDRAEKDFIARGLLHSYAVGDVMPISLGYVAEQDGRIVSRGQVLDLRVRLGMVTLRVAGLHALVTDESVRGRSIILPMIRYGYRHISDAGFDLALGFTRHENIYRLAGAATIAHEYEWQLLLAPTQAQPAQNWRLMQAHDLSQMLSWYASDQQDRVLSLVRDASLWSQLERQPPEVWVSENAYIGVRRSARGLELRELGVKRPQDYAQAFDFLCQLARDSQLPEVYGEQPVDHPISRLAVERGGGVHSTFNDKAGCVARIINPSSFVAKVLPELQRRCPALGRLSVRCDGVLATAHGGGHIDVEYSGSSLTWLRLVCGTLHWRQALQHDVNARIECPDDEALDALFAARHPYMCLCDRW